MPQSLAIAICSNMNIPGEQKRFSDSDIELAIEMCLFSITPKEVPKHALWNIAYYYRMKLEGKNEAKNQD